MLTGARSEKPWLVYVSCGKQRFLRDLNTYLTNVLDQPYYIANKIDPLGPINLTPTTQVATNTSGDDHRFDGKCPLLYNFKGNE